MLSDSSKVLALEGRGSQIHTAFDAPALDATIEDRCGLHFVDRELVCKILSLLLLLIDQIFVLMHLQ